MAGIRVLVLAVLLTAVAPRVSAAKESTWRKVLTPTFRIYSDASERATLEVANDLEALHGQLELLKARGKTVTPLPTNVFVFRNDRSFEAYQPKRQQSTKEVAGYFQAGQFGNFIAVNAGSSGVNQIIFHEYLHYFTHNNLPNVPLWVDEGLAEFFSSFGRERGNALIGRPLTEHVAWLRINQMIPMRRLLEIGHGSPEYNESERAGVFYAQSWAMIHYLLTGGAEKQQQLTEFLARSSGGEETAEAFQASFGTDFEGMEKQLWAHVKARRYGYFRLPYSDEALQIVSSEVSEAKVLSRLSELLLASRYVDFGQVRELLDRAQELSPEEPLVHYGLGLLAERENDPKSALESYAKATALESNDFEPWFRHGRLALRQLNAAMASTLSDAQNLKLSQARAALGHTIDLRPDYGPGFHQLGRSYFYGKPSSSGIASLSRARTLMPENQDVLRDLITMYSLLGHWTHAYSVFEGDVARLATEAEFSLALQELGRAEIYGISKLMAEGDATKAHRRLLALEQRTAGGEAALQSQVVHARRTVNHNLAVDQINRSRDLVKAGSLEEALKLLEGVAELTADESLRASAQQQIEAIGRVLERQ